MKEKTGQAKQLLREIAHSSDGKGVDIADFIQRFQVGHESHERTF